MAPTDSGASGSDPAAAAPDRHVPVLLDRVLGLLGPALDGASAVVVDATLGLGGHADALLRAHPQLTLIGLDRDPDALGHSERRLGQFAGRIHLIHAVYDRMADVLAELGIAGVDGVLFDLGVSSMQLDRSERGFAYAQDAPLDMRMDPTTGPTAAQVVNGYSVTQLAQVLRSYGEERFALRIARAIERAREHGEISSSAQLAELVRDAIPAATRRHGGHPAKRTFQALRIEVNGELDAVRHALPQALDALEIGGRIVVMSYQSLEDRIVKREFTRRTTDRSPAGLPVTRAEDAPTLRLLTRGAEAATAAEVAANPRAASARLRAAERIAVPA